MEAAVSPRGSPSPDPYLFGSETLRGGGCFVLCHPSKDRLTGDETAASAWRSGSRIRWYVPPLYELGLW
jgi:hypothetical protein